MAGESLEHESVDVPQVLLGHMLGHTARARIVSTESGVVAGLEALEAQAVLLELQATVHVSSGSRVQPGDVVATIVGSPVQVVRGEDVLLGAIAKVSGVATAARAAIDKAGRIRVVCGGWKKMPSVMKDQLRAALKAAGVDARIASGPFLYLDKNYIRLLGSLVGALQNARKLPGRAVAIQLRGETAPIAAEAITAARHGARVLMVDTGRVADVREVSAALRREGLRQQVEIAFAGNLELGELEKLQDEDVDIVDIGRAILDAPLLDFRYDVFEVKTDQGQR